MPLMLGTSPKSLRFRAFEALRLDRALLATGMGSEGMNLKLRLRLYGPGAQYFSKVE